MTALQSILETYRSSSKTEREKGTYFEELIRTYFRYEASHADLYSEVWLFADWAKAIGTPLSPASQARLLAPVMRAFEGPR
jgi:predicted helicase